MLKNYLTVALRNLQRYKGYTFINVTGLATGIACCLLIFLYVQDELGFDRFHEKADRIYRVINQRHDDTSGSVSDLAATPPGLAPALQEQFPEVLRAVRLFDMGETLMARGDRQFMEPNFFLADSTVFDVFSIRLLRGDPATALTAPRSLVLSATMAQKYFGTADPMGQTVRVSNGEDYRVTGVFEDLPAQSHLRISFLGSFDTLQDFVSAERMQNWIWQQFYTYVLLPEGYAPRQLEAKLPALIHQQADPQTTKAGFHYGFWLQPLTGIRLHSADLRFDVAATSDIAYVYAFSVVAVFILLIACFNFMNLSTARSMQRAREVGMRKVVGAHRLQLVGQFLGESVLLALLALVLALLLVGIALPSFNHFTGKTLHYPGSAWWGAGLLATGVLVGLLAGSYPAFFLSAFQPLRVLKGTTNAGGPSLTLLRKGLVVTQFAISIALIIGTSVVYSQLAYVRNTNLGFNQEQIVVLPMRGTIGDDVETVKTELLRSPLVAAATSSWGVPGGIVAGDGIRLPGSNTDVPTSMFTVDFDYIDTFEMEMVAGRAFSRAFPSDAREAFIVNETLARQLGWTPEAALGKQIAWDMWGRDSVKVGSVIGVVKDFNYRTLRQAVEPLVMHLYPEAAGNISVRLRPENVPAALSFLEATWKRWAPDWPFDYTFLDQEFAALYESDRQLGQIFGAFAVLAVLIACLGLFGLASFTAERRTKEIGVRKVLGASLPQITFLLSAEFAKLVLIAFVLAAPVAYVGMSRWLADFAYRTQISPTLFVLAGLAALGVALATVSYQAVRAALTDPVESLRYE